MLLTTDGPESTDLYDALAVLQQPQQVSDEVIQVWRQDLLIAIFAEVDDGCG